MSEHLHRQAASGSSGVAAIGVAQEFQRVWTASEGHTCTGTHVGRCSRPTGGSPATTSTCGTTTSGRRSSRPAPTSPTPARCGSTATNGPKRQAVKAGIGFTALASGFAACNDPTAVQDVCDRLGPGTINVFVQRWLARLPLPFDQADRDAGYRWEVSLRQVETSRTIVFDAPRHARGFFEASGGRCRASPC